jgi:hypothetical protein
MEDASNEEIRLSKVLPNSRPSERFSLKPQTEESLWNIYDNMSAIQLLDTISHIFTDCDLDDDGELTPDELS